MSASADELRAELELAYSKFGKAHEAGDVENAKAFKGYALELERAIDELDKAQQRPAATPAKPNGGAVEVPDSAPDIPASSKPGDDVADKDLWTALKVGGTQMVSNYLSGRERELQSREGTKKLVFNKLPKEWQAELSKERDINQMTFPEMDNLAKRKFGKDYTDRLGQINSEDPELGQHISDAISYGNTGIYENIIRPYFSKDGPDLANEWQQKVEDMRAKYSESAKESVGKPFLAEDAEFFDPGSWFDKTTKAPWHDFDGFLLTTIEQTPQLSASIIAARTGGRIGGSAGIRSVGGLENVTPAIARQAISRGATIGGTVAGAATEGVLIRDSVSQQTYDQLMSLDDTTWKTSEQYHKLRDGGLTDTEAKQIVSSEIARTTGNTAMVVSGFMMGAPAGALFGRMAGGQASRSVLKNMLTGAAVEMGQETAQEGVEQITQNLGVRRVDPTQNVFEGVGEAMVGAAFTVGPIGALGGATSTVRKGPGLSADEQQVLDAFKPYEKAKNNRWKLQNEISDKNWGNDKTAEERLNALTRLENLQEIEADEFLRAEPVMRKHMIASGATDEKLVLLDQLKRSAKTMKDQVGLARNSRNTAEKMAEDARKQLFERQSIVAMVEQETLHLADIERMADNIHKVRNLEALDDAGYAELERNGYGRWSAAKDKFIITPKGKRAATELEQQAEILSQRIKSGYLGKERRSQENLSLRDRIDQMTPEQREAAIMRDDLTGLLNRRAFNEKEDGGGAGAYAKVDLDSLKWVNDNMSEDAGNELIKSVARVLNSQDGVTAYRTGGDEFYVTGASEQEIEEAIQNAKRELQGMEPIVHEGQSIQPQITWATGPNAKTASKNMNSRKVEREAKGKRAGRGKPPSTLRTLAQGLLLQRDETEGETESGGEQSLENEVREITRGYMDINPDARGALVIQQDLYEQLGGADVLTFVRDANGHPALRASEAARMFRHLAGMNGIENNNQISAAYNAVFRSGKGLSAQSIKKMLKGKGTVTLRTMNKILTGMHLATVVAKANIQPHSPSQWTAAQKEAIANALESPVMRVSPMYDIGRPRARRSQPRQSSLDFPLWSGPTIPLKPPGMTEQEFSRATAAISRLSAMFGNLPKVTLVETVDDLPEQIQAQLRAMGGNPFAVRGMFDERDPRNGVFIIGGNVRNVMERRASGKLQTADLERGIAESFFHEVVGHYGIRGLLGSQQELDRLMNTIVKSFPSDARHIAAMYGLNPAIPAQRSLIGEEVLAFKVGELLAKQGEVTPAQRNVLERAIQWIKERLTAMGFGRFMRMNDKDIQDLIVKMQGFVRYGDSWKFRTRAGQVQTLAMRDAEIFQSGLSLAIRTATRKLSKRERAEYERAGKTVAEDGTVPLFEDGMNLNQVVTALQYANKADNRGVKLVSDLEMETSGIMDAVNRPLWPDLLDVVNLTPEAAMQKFGLTKAEMAQFEKGEAIPRKLADNLEKMARDAGVGVSLYTVENIMKNNGLTYGQLMVNFAEDEAAGGISDRFGDMLPPALAKEWADLFEAATNQTLDTNEYVANSDRREEIKSMPVDKAHTKISRARLDRFATRPQALQVFVKTVGFRPSYAFKQIWEKVGGGADWDGHPANTMGYSAGAPQGAAEINDSVLREKWEAELERVTKQGPDIGFDSALNRWYDVNRFVTEYGGYVPNILDDPDAQYREALIFQSERPGETLPEPGHWSRANHQTDQGKRGVIFHVRHGTVEDGSPNPPDAPNPDNKGKAWYLAELQSDWFSRAYRAYRTQEERSEGHLLKSNLQFALQRAVAGVVSNIGYDVQVRIGQMFQETAIDEVIRSQLLARTATETGSTIEQVVESNTVIWSHYQMLLNRVRGEALSKRLLDIIVEIDVKSNEMDQAGSTPDEYKRMREDIREFEYLDYKAAGIFLGQLNDILKRASTVASRMGSDYRDLTDIAKRIEGSVLNMTDGHKGDEWAPHRIGFGRDKFELATKYFYEALGIPEAAVKRSFAYLDTFSSFRMEYPDSLVPESTSSSASAYVILKQALDRAIVRVNPAFRSEDFSVIRNEANDGSIVVFNGDQKRATMLREDIKSALSSIEQELTDEWNSAEDRRVKKLQRERDYASGRSSLTVGQRTYDFFGFEEDNTEAQRTHSDIWKDEDDWIDDNIEGYLDSVRENFSEYFPTDELQLDGQTIDEDHPEYRERIRVVNGEADLDEANDWLEEARNEARDKLMEPGGAGYEMAHEDAREAYQSDPPQVWRGTLPIRWDSDGDIEEDVPVDITYEGNGGEWKFWIDVEELGSSYDSNRLKQGLAQWTSDWIESRNQDLDDDSGVNPPEGWRWPWTPVDPVATTNEPIVRGTTPDFGSAVNALISNTPEPVGTKIDVGKLFEDMVKTIKRTNADIVAGSPLQSDKIWRATALKYVISDAVRRGFSKVMWQGGEANTARGNISPAWTSLDKITWSMQTVTTRGKDHPVVVFDWHGAMRPLAIPLDRVIPVFGRDVYNMILDQKAGRVPRSVNGGREPSRADLLISNTGHHFIIQRAGGTSRVLAFATDEATINAKADEMVRRAKERGGWGETDGSRKRSRHPATFPGSDLELDLDLTGEWGEITEGMLGGPINALIGRSYEYQHSYGLSGHSSTYEQLAGGRLNYDFITVNEWNRLLRKYGTEIKRGQMKVPPHKKDTLKDREGVKLVSHQPESLVAKYGRIEVVEMRGEAYGWLVMGETGTVLDMVFPTEEDAIKAMDLFIEQNAGDEAAALGTVYEFEITDQMREEFSGPVAPFHYDPYTDPVLADAAKKIGSKQPSLRERYNQWRYAWKDKFLQGAIDRFHGIKKGLNDAGLADLPAEDNPYIQARLTTSLDSVMKSVMEYGHPVWKEGMVQSEGRGLMEILDPVAKNVELWAMYMAGVRAKRLKAEGREKLFEDAEIDAMVRLGDAYPVFKQVAADYAEFNKRVLDFAEQAGIIDATTRPMWENADYVPFYRVEDDRLVGPMSAAAGVANQRSPIRRLKGGESNVGDIMHNIMVNLTKLVDGAMKNHAALMAIDALREHGIVQREPLAYSAELIPLGQVKKLLIERGMDPAAIPPDALAGFQKMFAMQAPKGEGILSVMRAGKKEFYYTDDPILFRAMTAINKKSFGAWMNLLRAPKRLLTAWVTLDPGFMIANYIRDAVSAFVLSRDTVVPLLSGAKGFAKALIHDSDMRTLISSGAAFESGYINQYDPAATRRLLKKKLKDKTFARTVLDSPLKLYEAWKAIGSATENANRLAVYSAAIGAGKSKAQAAYEAKDLMDFSMGGDWPFIQFLLQTVPFMGARIQGLHRLGRGMIENPVAFTMKGTLVGLAGLALWFAYKDDERYKDLEDWDKDVYFHFWLGDQHYRLPKPFEVGAIFNTIPERVFEYMYSKETDAGKLLMKRFGFMIAETFNMNPTPQAVRPLIEGWFNRNFFTGNQIESPYEEKRLPPERFRYYTSPTMVEIARGLPSGLDTVSEKIRSPLQLQNLYYGYTGTLGRYFLMGADALVREAGEIPLPPEKTLAEYPVVGRFARGDNPRRTRYEEEFYNLLRKTVQIQGSVKFLQDASEDDLLEYVEGKYEPYINVSRDLQNASGQISRLNKSIREVYMDPAMTPQEKRVEIDSMQAEKNEIFKEAYRLRPGAEDNPISKTTPDKIRFLINEFDIDQPPPKELAGVAPTTANLLADVASMERRQLEALSKATGANK